MRGSIRVESLGLVLQKMKPGSVYTKKELMSLFDRDMSAVARWMKYLGEVGIIERVDVDRKNPRGQPTRNGYRLNYVRITP